MNIKEVMVKGILFKPDMIKAIVEGRKTVTRRVITFKPPVNGFGREWSCPFKTEYLDNWIFTAGFGLATQQIRVKPRYQVGEVVYIKEAHRYIQNDGDPYDFGIQYKSDSQVKWWRDNGNLMDYPIDEKWRSPLFLKELFARYFLKIVGVRAERVQEISEEDARAEGVIPYIEDAGDGHLWSPGGAKAYRLEFKDLWDSINKDYPFESNPYVFRYGFNRI